MNFLNIIKTFLSSVSKDGFAKATATSLAWLGLKQLLLWYQDYVEKNEDHLNIRVEIEGKDPINVVVSTARISSLTNKIEIPFIPEPGETITLNDIDKVEITRVDVEPTE